MSKRRFFSPDPLTIWLVKSAVSGVVYATAAFFTRKWWERKGKD
jgi:hypothetical protein